MTKSATMSYFFHAKKMVFFHKDYIFNTPYINKKFVPLHVFLRKIQLT